MAQHDYVLDNAAGAAFRADLNNALSAIISANSGTTEPATMFAYQFWADTTAGILKQRNAANSAWISILTMSTGATTANAALAGSSAQTFSVAAASAIAHAVRLDQIQGASITAFTTGGTGTAYTITATGGIAAYTANQTFNIIFHAACGAAPTLTISGVGTPPNLVRQLLDGSYQNLAANDLPAGWQSTVKLVSATQALVMKLPRRCKLISATRDMTAASGSVAYTGVGFKAAKITAQAMVQGLTPHSSGTCNANLEQMYLDIANTSAYNSTGAAYILQIHSTTAAAAQYANVTAIGNDGFSVSWGKVGAPAAGTATLHFMCEE